MSRLRGHGRQLGLFGEAEPPRVAEREVGAAEVEPELEALASRLPRGIRFGTSSWSFPGWKGIVYDREAAKTVLARRGLGAYAQHPLLGAVGIDRTYYGLLPARELADYAAAVPEGFRFLVKASSELTTPFVKDRGGRTGKNERFLDAEWAAEYVIGPFVDGLGDRAGPLVFQFPPVGGRLGRAPERFAEMLASFLGRLPAGPHYAVELRNRALFTNAYLAALTEAGASHCFNVHPRMPPVAEQWKRARADGPTVVRWMLHAGLGYEEAKERYQPFDRIVDEDVETRRTLTTMALETLAAGRSMVVIANNKAEGSAPRSVFALARSIARGLEGD